MGELRITGGEFKGRRLKVARGVRPTSARLREALFNLLGDSVRGATVLDLFAGSGALGLEALSRGAREAVFVERRRGPLMVLRRNIASLGLSGRAHAIGQDWHRAVARRAKVGQRFYLILADPPYGFWRSGELGTKLLQLLTDFDIVAENGILVIEMASRT